MLINLSPPDHSTAIEGLEDIKSRGLHWILSAEGGHFNTVQDDVKCVSF